jgi:hypothetical protein
MLSPSEAATWMIPVFKELGMPDPGEQFVVQFSQGDKQHPSDLILRIRFVNLSVRTAVSKLSLTSEHRLYGGRDKPNQEVREWLEQAAKDAYCLAHATCLKRAVPLIWPSGWPIPPYKQVMEAKKRHMYGLPRR